MHDIDEIVRIEDLAKQFVRGTACRVQVRPLLSELEGFVFPRFEARLLNDSGLQDFFAREDAPCHGVDGVLLAIRPYLAIFSYSVVSKVL